MSPPDDPGGRARGPLRRRPSVQCEEVAETAECVLLEPSEGRVLALNPLGTALWELLDGERDADELARILAAGTGVEPERARLDVAALLDQLEGEGFLAAEG